MNHSSPTRSTASSLPAGKITRQQLAAHCGLCVRSIDELTRSGVLGHYKIGKSVRYDLAEVEATLRQRFHVQPTPQVPASMTARTESIDTQGGDLRTRRPPRVSAARDSNTTKGNDLPSFATACPAPSKNQPQA